MLDRMKTILTILFLIIWTSLYSQSNEVELFQRLDTIQTTTGLSLLKEEIRFQKEYTEYLNLGIEHTNWLLYKGKRKKPNRIRLLTLSLGEKIFYREFFGDKKSENFELTFEKFYAHEDRELLDRLNNQARKTLGDTISVGHVQRSHDRSTFGYACYVSASMPPDGERMLVFVSDNNIRELLRWLRSIDPVKQAYAYVGMKLLQSEGMLELTGDIEELLNKLEICETSIYTCAGCMTWEYSQIKDVLTKEDVDRFIDRRKLLR